MDFLYVKALHIIFVVTWFAGLFYIVRLFIYHAEANESKDETSKKILTKQYQLMESRLWNIITWPSAILASIFGFWMLYQAPSYLEQPWMHVKLSMVLLLYIYHGICHKMYLKFQKDESKNSSIKLRFWNEVATILLFAIVFTVVLKSTTNWIFGVVGLIGLSIIMMIAIKWYKRFREKN